MTKESKLHLARVASLGCVACRNTNLGESPASAHHINCATMGRKSSDFETIPLCPTHHQYSGHGEIAVHDGLESWEARYGTERELLIQTWDELGIDEAYLSLHAPELIARYFGS